MGGPSLTAVPLRSAFRAGESEHSRVEALTGREYLVLVAGAMAIGLVVRFFSLAGTDFPLGDGGMFFVMVQNLLAHHLALPSTTTYNHAQIPFSYPPLGFYVIALLHDLAGVDLLTAFRLFPLCVSVLTIGAFGLLARALLRSPLAAVMATFAFAMLPQSFWWELQGGGITRAPGMLFALLAIWQAESYLRGNANSYFPAVLFGALTVLFHLEWTWFAAYSVLILGIASGRSRLTLLRLAAIAGGVAILMSPWLWLVLSRNGPGPFVAVVTGSGGGSSGLQLVSGLLTLDLTTSAGFPIATAAALIGIAVSLFRRAYLLPVWLLVIFLIDGRAPLERTVVLVALLAGVGADALLRSETVRVCGRRVKPGTRILAVAGVAIWTVTTCLLWEANHLSTLSPASRAAMAWASRNTPPASSFAVVNSVDWPLNLQGEWLPALAGRRSVTLVQGSEWEPGGMKLQSDHDDALQKCALLGSQCLQRWMDRTGLKPAYVWVSKRMAGQLNSGADCCWALRVSLQHDPRYVRVYDGPAASIFRRR